MERNYAHLEQIGYPQNGDRSKVRQTHFMKTPLKLWPVRAAGNYPGIRFRQIQFEAVPTFSEQI
jgi:hypothetical protein